MRSPSCQQYDDDNGSIARPRDKRSLGRKINKPKMGQMESSAVPAREPVRTTERHKKAIREIVTAFPIVFSGCFLTAA